MKEIKSNRLNKDKTNLEKSKKRKKKNQDMIDINKKSYSVPNLIGGLWPMSLQMYE